MSVISLISTPEIYSQQLDLNCLLDVNIGSLISPQTEMMYQIDQQIPYNGKGKQSLELPLSTSRMLKVLQPEYQNQTLTVSGSKSTAVLEEQQLNGEDTLENLPCGKTTTPLPTETSTSHLSSSILSSSPDVECSQTISLTRATYWALTT